MTTRTARRPAPPEMSEAALLANVRDLAERWPSPPDPRDVYIDVELDIEPVPKGRPRVSPAEFDAVGGQRTRTKAAHVYTPQGTKDYQERVGWLLKSAGVKRNDTDDLGVLAVFHVRGQQRRDVDNLVKSLLDGCNGVAWRDDQQVTRLATEVARDSEHPRVELTVYVVSRRARNCDKCGRALTPRQVTLEQAYCSKACYDTAQRKGTNRVCVTCGTTVWRDNEKSRAKEVFCSPECRTARRDRCRQCGESTGKPPSSSNRFCSPKCSEAWHRTKAPGPAPPPLDEQQVTRLPSRQELGLPAMAGELIQRPAPYAGPDAARCSVCGHWCRLSGGVIGFHGDGYGRGCDGSDKPPLAGEGGDPA